MNGSGSSASMSRTFSHSNAKLVVSVFERGSASMRRTCCSSTLGSLSLPCSATVSSSSSGMLLHRKNDRRDASSRAAQPVDAAGLGARPAAVPRDTGTSSSRASRPARSRCRVSNVPAFRPSV